MLILEKYIKEVFENKEIIPENDYNQKKLKNEIKRDILSEADDSITCDLLRDSLIQSRIEYYHISNSYNKYRYYSYQYIWDACRSNNLISPKNAIWTHVFKNIFCLIDNDDSRLLDQNLERAMNRREDKIVEIVYGPIIGRYHFKIADGSVLIEKEKAEKVVRDIASIIKQIGSFNVLNAIFDMIYNNNYDVNIKRYLFPKQFYKLNDNVKIHLPINYLINICIKNIYIYPKKKLQNNDIDKKLTKLTKLISQFVYLYDTQQFTYMSDGILSRVDDAGFIHKYILYDHFFRFSQISQNYRSYILNSLLKSSKIGKIKEKLNFSLDEYKTTIDKIYNIKGYGIIKLPKNKFTSNELFIIDSISHKKDINKNYSLPTEYNNVENPYFLKPLIKRGEDYFLIDKCYSAWSFYEVILQKLNYKYMDIGTNIEDAIKEYLIKKGFSIYCGNYEGSVRECDIVVEEQEHILFIEVKKKAITRNSISGSPNDILIDLIDMYIHSQEQALAHEIFIRKHNEIKFIDGKRLSLLNREISTISITLFDSYTLNDRSLCIKIMEYILKLKFEIRKGHEEDKNIERIKKSLKEKNSKIKNLNKYLLELCGDDEKEYRKKTFNTWFLSLELFLFFIDESIKEQKSLSSIINTIRSISFSTGEVYSEYKNSNRIKNAV